jgi:hypothetical protein
VRGFDLLPRELSQLGGRTLISRASREISEEPAQSNRCGVEMAPLGQPEKARRRPRATRLPSIAELPADAKHRRSVPQADIQFCEARLIGRLPD